MDADTAALVQTIGNDLLHSFAAIVVETFFLAIYTILIILASRVLLRKGFKRVPMITLLALLVMYIMALIMWSFDVTDMAREIVVTLINNPDSPMSDKYAIAVKNTFDFVAAEDVLYAFMSNIGDGIIIWRVYALWRQTRRAWLILIPLALLLGSFVSSLLLTYCVAHLGTQIVDGSFQSPAFCRNVQTASYSMATVTTAIATLLIGLKTWEYRNSIKPMVSGGSTGSGTRVERFLILLIESGVLYFLFFLVQVIGNVPGVEANPRLSFAMFVYSFSTSVVVGMYPTIIIILAHSDSAVLDSAVASTLRPSNYSNFKASVNSGRTLRQTNSHQLTEFTVSTTASGQQQSQHAEEEKEKPVLPL